MKHNNNVSNETFKSNWAANDPVDRVNSISRTNQSKLHMYLDKNSLVFFSKYTHGNV